MATEQTSWTLKGTALISCNCEYGCPCNFNALPTYGNCEGGWTWHVEHGSFGDVPLDALNFSVYAKWPGALHMGNGEAVIFVDQRADARQREAIETLVAGKTGGPWGVLGWTWPKLHGTFALPYEVTLSGATSRMTAGDAVEYESTLSKNPVNGAEVHPGIVLPEGIIVKRADLGRSSVFRVTRGVPMDHSGKYTAVGPFEYAYP
jgi:hypothetical protein